jgi:type 1 glutamine amidotransferase
MRHRHAGMSKPSTPTFVRRFSPLLLALGAAAGLASLMLQPAATAADADGEKKVKPLKALLIIGGCCHDYEKQKDLLKAGIEARAHVEVEIAYNPDKSTKPKFEAYLKDNWYAGYDVIIHDECAADVTEADYIANVLKPHKEGVPGVNLHCAMHSYRSGDFKAPVQAGADNAGWFEYLGLQSFRHDWQAPVAITFTDKEHPSVKGLSDWTTIKEELYNVVQMVGGKQLASGKQPLKDGKEWEAAVVWTNEYGPKKTRVWSTSLGHNNETVGDARYLDMVTRGLLWSCDRLNDSYLKPAAK